MGLKCYRATLNDSVTAWFSPEIPVSEGPDVYAGLPGLILDLEDGQNVYRCIAIDTNSRSEVAAKKRGKKVSTERFEELRKQMLDR
jgi:GLPGLI family protein